MEQNSSEADSSVSPSSRRAYRRADRQTIRLKRMIRLYIYISTEMKTVFRRSSHMKGTGFYIFAGFPGMPISRWRPVKQLLRRKYSQNSSSDLQLDELSV